MAAARAALPPRFRLVRATALLRLIARARPRVQTSRRNLKPVVRETAQKAMKEERGAVAAILSRRAYIDDSSDSESSSDES